jgi:hypothetical protein
VLDWYDRYHCYQDARRDPEGVDRGHGRLYRIRYQDTPRVPRFDMAAETNQQLIERLHSDNVYIRETAQRLLSERAEASATRPLQQLVLNEATPAKTRLHALWALIGAGPLDAGFHEQLFAHEDAAVRAWAVRAAGNQGQVSEAVRDQVRSAVDDAPDVQLQVAIAARKIEGLDALPLLIAILAHCGDDPLIPHIVWENLHPLLEDQSGRFLQLAREAGLKKNPNLARLMPRVLRRISAGKPSEAGAK